MPEAYAFPDEQEDKKVEIGFVRELLRSPGDHGCVVPKTATGGRVHVITGRCLLGPDRVFARGVAPNQPERSRPASSSNGVRRITEPRRTRQCSGDGGVAGHPGLVVFRTRS